MMRAISIAAAHKSSDFLQKMFRLRYQRFLKEQNYRAFEINGMEFDQYDLLSTIYLVKLNPEDEVLGCIRLNSTKFPYMLKQLWPELIDGTPPESDSIWEGSRICVDGRLPKEMRRRIVQEILLGYMEFGLANTIEKYIGVMHDDVWANVFGRCGWQYTLWSTGKAFEPSQPQRMAHAGYVIVSEETLAQVREATGIRESVLTIA